MTPFTTDAIFEFGLGCNGTPYTSPYTTNNYLGASATSNKHFGSRGKFGMKQLSEKKTVDQDLAEQYYLCPGIMNRIKNLKFKW